MRIEPQHSLLPLLRAGGQDPAPTPERESRDPGKRSGTPVPRVYEGEVLPRPIVATRLLDGLRAIPSVANPAVPAGTGLPSASAKTLFYLLHSSSQSLDAGRPGTTIDQYA